MCKLNLVFVKENRLHFFSLLSRGQERERWGRVVWEDGENGGDAGGRGVGGGDGGE